EDVHATVAGLVDNLLRPNEDVGAATVNQLFEATERVGGRIPVRLSELAQGIGVKAGGAGEAGATHFSSLDDGVETLDEGGAHESPISHCNVIQSGNNVVPTVIWR